MAKKSKDPTEKVLDTIIEAACDKKAVDPVILNIKRSKTIFDYLVIVSGESSAQLKAIAEQIEHKVKALGVIGRVYEGQIDSGWLVLDLDEIVVHIMNEAERAYYNIEGIWGKDAVVYHA